jgi:hypothetical protein
MSDFALKLNMFIIHAESALSLADPLRHEAVFGDAGDNMLRVPLETIFKAGPIPDHEEERPIDYLLKSMVISSDLDNWVKMGGSPLIATRHNAPEPYRLPPILGYRKCLLEDSSGVGLLGGNKIKELSLEQWRLGTDDEMVASGLLRALSTGLIQCHSIGDKIPEALFDAFKNPSVEAKLVEELRVMPIQMRLERVESIYERQDHVLMTAYVFDRLGLTALRQAVLDSPAFRDGIRPNAINVEHILWATLCENKHQNMRHAQKFLHNCLGVDPTDEVIDQALKKPFNVSGNTTNREFVYERATRRMEFLIENGRLPQARYWLKEALPHMDRFPVINDELKSDFLAACQICFYGSIFEGLSEAKPDGLEFLITTLGHDAFNEAFRQTCDRAVTLATVQHGEYSFKPCDLLGIDVKTLNAQGVLHETLDSIMAVYPMLWAGTAQTIHFRKQKWGAERRFEDVTKWVGEALTEAPSTERAVAWFKLFEYPFAQEAYVAAIPPTQAVFSLMSLKQRAVQFGQDLGL